MEISTLITALLVEAKEQNVSPVLRTTLVKYLYLLDVYMAEENEGKTITGLEWKFQHYGPFSGQLARHLEDMTNKQVIISQLLVTDTEDKEFVLYSLNANKRFEDFQRIGIPSSVKLKLLADMKRYGKNLPSLLDRVYFNTAPMNDAQPGEVLDFKKCRKTNIEDVRHIEMKTIRPSAIKDTRVKLKALIESRKSKPEIKYGPYDETYYLGLQMLDGEPLNTGLTGRAKLNV